MLAHALLRSPQNPPLPERRLTIGAHTLTVEVADTTFTRMRGLSNRESLLSGCGMLFVFPAKGRYGFWMKDMRFPLDLVWIADGSVVGVTANVPPPIDRGVSGFRTYYPPAGVDQVLELNAGEALQLGIVSGMPVSGQ